MSYYGSGSECDRRLKEENARLKREAEDRRYEDDRRRDREEREAENQRRQRQQERQEAMMTASTWEEALWKGRNRYEQEAREEAKDNAQIAAAVQADPALAADPVYQETTFFRDSVAVIDRAAVLYQQTMASVEEEIKRLRQAALNTVADRLDAEFPQNCIADEFRKDNPSGLVYW